MAVAQYASWLEQKVSHIDRGPAKVESSGEQGCRVPPHGVLYIRVGRQLVPIEAESSPVAVVDRVATTE